MIGDAVAVVVGLWIGDIHLRDLVAAERAFARAGHLAKVKPQITVGLRGGGDTVKVIGSAAYTIAVARYSVRVIRYGLALPGHLVLVDLEPGRVAVLLHVVVVDARRAPDTVPAARAGKARTGAYTVRTGVEPTGARYGDGDDGAVAQRLCSAHHLHGDEPALRDVFIAVVVTEGVIRQQALLVERARIHRTYAIAEVVADDVPADLGHGEDVVVTVVRAIRAEIGQVDDPKSVLLDGVGQDGGRGAVIVEACHTGEPARARDHVPS